MERQRRVCSSATEHLKSTEFRLSSGEKNFFSGSLDSVTLVLHIVPISGRAPGGGPAGGTPAVPGFFVASRHRPKQLLGHRKKIILATQEK
jgi:hypothetical protein